MLITMIVITAFLTLLHYTGIESLLVYFIGLPIEIYIGILILLVLVKLGQALLKVIPYVRNLYRSIARMTSKIDQFSSKLDKSNKEDSPFKNGGKRTMSSSSRQSHTQNPLQGVKDSVKASGEDKRFNLLEAIRTKYVVATKMVPLTDKIGHLLFLPFTMNNILSMGRVTRLARRISTTKKFLDFVLKYNKHHGALATVKWLKASYVALQKALGQDVLKSTVSLGTPLHYSRLAGRGLPRIIPASERRLINSGDVRTIRFWSGLFNLYRVLKVPGELKLQTITGPYTGSRTALSKLIIMLRRESAPFKGRLPNFFGSLRGFSFIREADLSPTEFVLSRSASPSNKHSCLGILTDIWYLNKYSKELWQEILYYLHACKPEVTPFIEDLQTGYELVTRLAELPWSVTGKETGKELTQSDHIMVKGSIRQHGLTGHGVSQFALKEEAAGKIRLFALLDSITQSSLAPLHETLFKLLRSIPNDGTFNQDASIKRSQAKAIKAGKAFSFDLTAATDRIPAKLTAEIIGMIFQNLPLAQSWLNIMTNREFFFNEKVAEKAKVSAGPYRYAVGQPMGGLSSWAGLAITHHWIVQLAAYRAYGTSIWFEGYEILGDDLVIFDENVAREYLKIMESLGCEINLTKSIRSPNRPVFEFAKRTCWGSNIVSGISLAQVRAGWRVAGRVANALSFVTSGLITKPSLLAITLSRYAFQNGKASTQFVNKSHKAVKLFSLGVLSLFGTLYQSGIMPLKVLMTALVNPHYEDADYSGEAVGLPLKASLNIAFSMLTNHTIPEEPFSHMDKREEIFDEYHSELVTTMLQKALSSAKRLFENKEFLIKSFAHKMFYPYYYSENGKQMDPVPYSDLPDDVHLLYLQVESYANKLLGMEVESEDDPEKLYEELYALAYKQAKYPSCVTFEEASAWLDKVEALEFKLTVKDVEKPGKTIIESAPILATLRNMDPSKSLKITYNQAPQFVPVTAVTP